MRVLLLLVFSFSAFAAGTPAEEWFKVEFRQDDKALEIVDHTVKLKRDKFSIFISLKNGGSIGVNASLDSANFGFARQGKELQDFECFLPGTGMAEGMENKEYDMSLNAFAHNHWYYEDEKAHRFNKVVKNGDWVTGERVIKKIWILENEISDAFKVSQFPRDTFYIVFMKSQFQLDDYKELQRDYVRVIFEP